MKKRPKYRLLIQQDGGPVIDTYESFGVVCQEFPFKYLPETKELPKRDWYDEDGEDVYVPKDGLRFAAYDLEVKFLYVGKDTNMSSDLKDFIDYLYGRINYVKDDKGNVVKVTTNVKKDVMLAVYDEYTKTGKSGVYMREITSNLFDISDIDPDAIAIFSARFRVTDPISDIVLNKER